MRVLLLRQAGNWWVTVPIDFSTCHLKDENGMMIPEQCIEFFAVFGWMPP